MDLHPLRLALATRVRGLSPRTRRATPASGAPSPLSTDGRTAVVGGAADAGGTGAVWVFVRSGDTWTQAGPKLVPGDEVGAGRFGGTVAVSADGGTILAGAHDDDGGAGAVWLFEASGGSWAQQGPKLASPGGSGAVQFGSRVAVSADGETALIGAPADAGGRGAAWIFTRASGEWSTGVRLAPAAGAHAGAFGSSVALAADGDTALVGAPEDGGGSAWTFARAGSGWREQGPGLRAVAAGGAGAFGTSVALSADGGTALVGAGGDAGGAGAAWIFGRSRGRWVEEAAKLAPADASGVASIGSTAALSGDASTALLGGPGDSGYAGAAWVFATPPSSPTPQDPDRSRPGVASAIAPEPNARRVAFAYAPIPYSRSASLSDVFWSVDSARWPMISAQPTWYVPAGNSFGRVPGTTTERGGT